MLDIGIEAGWIIVKQTKRCGRAKLRLTIDSSRLTFRPVFRPDFAQMTLTIGECFPFA